MVCAAWWLRNVSHNTRFRDRSESNAATHGPQHHEQTLHQERSGRDSSRGGTNGCAVSTKYFGSELRQRKMQKQLFNPILNEAKFLCAIRCTERARVSPNTRISPAQRISILLKTDGPQIEGRTTNQVVGGSTPLRPATSAAQFARSPNPSTLSQRRN